MVVGAVDQDAANAHVVAHFAERDFLGRCEHYFDFALSPRSEEAKTSIIGLKRSNRRLIVALFAIIGACQML